MDEDEAATPYAVRERFWRGRDVAFTPLEPDDAELIHSWRADPVAAHETGVWPGSLHEFRERVEAHVEDRDRDDFLVLLPDGTPGGTSPSSRRTWSTAPPRPTLLAAGHRRRGLGADALAALTDLAFGELGLHRVEAVTHTDNTAALATLRRAGFVHEGVRRSSCLHRGRRYDNAILGLLRAEWEALERPRSWEH